MPPTRTLGGMNRHALVVIAVCAGLVAGCGSRDQPLSRKEVERQVSTLVGDTKGGDAEAKCVELPTDRVFRCQVSVNAVAGTYEARLSKSGERIELKER